MVAGKLWGVLREAGAEWMDDDAPRLAAALAYYTLLSLAPLLVIAVAVAGFLFGEDAARRALFEQVRGTVGDSGADVIKDMLEQAGRPGAGSVAAVVGVVTLLFGASGVFAELQGALNVVWDVRPKPGRGVWGVVRDRLLSFAMVLVIGALLLGSVVASAVLSGAEKYFGGAIPAGLPVSQAANAGLGFVVVTVLFAMVFKILPDVRVRWREVWLGAAVTAALFTLGKYLIGLYLGKAGVATPFGAAGSLVALVVWVQYSALILYFGAELTQVVARRNGSGQPTGNAEWISPPSVKPD